MRILLRCLCGNVLEDFNCQPVAQIEYIVRPCKKCASESAELAATDSQQLQAKIAALETKLADAINSCSWQDVRSVSETMRQLSAVQ